MRPKLSLAGINRLRMAIALLAGGMTFGLSVMGRSTTNASAMVDSTLMSVLWIYIGVTSVPWASLKGMAGAGATPALTMVGFSAYLAAATAFSGYTVVENPVWREPPRAPAPPRCVPDPAAAPAASPTPAPAAAPPAPVAAPPAPAPALPAPVVAPAPVAAVPDASTGAPVAAVPDASVREAAPGDAGGEESEGRRRRRRRRDDDEEEEDDSRPPPSAVLERDQPG